MHPACRGGLRAIDGLLVGITLDVIDQGEVEWDERRIQPSAPGWDMVRSSVNA